MRGLLTPYGVLRTFKLIINSDTNESKGYAFCEYDDVSVNDKVKYKTVKIIF